MSTACFELAREIPSRLSELRILTSHARQSQDSDFGLYNVLCRSCCVLMASHIEGFLKDLTSSLISDLNYYSGGFDKLPEALQNTFCQQIAFYEGVEKRDVITRSKQLRSFFTTNSVPVDLKAFPYRESNNKNASGNFIDSSLEKIGIPKVFNLFSNESFKVVFDNSHRSNYLLYRKMKTSAASAFKFPYVDLKSFIADKPPKGESQKETIWHVFIEDVMNRRHNIVHGDIKSNESSWEELEQDIDKLGILMYGLLYSSTSFVARLYKKSLA